MLQLGASKSVSSLFQKYHNTSPHRPAPKQTPTSLKILLLYKHQGGTISL
jgi:hypothetical protein